MPSTDNARRQCSPRPPICFSGLGLLESLGMVRMRGLAAIQHYIREQVRKAAA